MEQEPDAGLGNGGLGRLAACFLDSMATMQLPAMGYGLRYEYGMFRQTIENGWQREQPDNWLRRHDPWEVARPSEAVEIKLGCSFGISGGSLQLVPGRPSTLIGIPFDRPVVGYGGKTINTPAALGAAAPDDFDFQEFSSGDFVGARWPRHSRPNTLTRVLYPDDSTEQGQGLRFVQEYFLVACSLADLVRRFRRDNADWSSASRQGRDPAQRHPSDPGGARADAHPARRGAPRVGEAWDLTQRTLAYTNHTLLPEALEKWPVALFREAAAAAARNHLRDQSPLPRRCPAPVSRRRGRVARVSLIEEGPDEKVRMANLAIVGSHSTNGVAAIHSELLRTTTVQDLAEMFPERFNNKTNGVTPRRWLLLANPGLSRIDHRRDRRRLDHRSRPDCAN